MADVELGAGTTFGDAPGITSAEPSASGGRSLMDAITGIFKGGGPAARPYSPYEDEALILKVMQQAKRDALSLRWVYERLWWRNLLYLLGRQWIFFDDRSRTWKDKRLAKWIPRPVTNKMAESGNTIRALYAAVEFSAIVRPTSQDPKNVATAEICDDLAPVLHEEHEMERILNEHDFWMVATGNAFLHSYWDKRYEHGQLLIPFERCAACGKVSPPDQVLQAGNKCPACGSPNLDLAHNQDGSLAGETLPQGRGVTVVYSPLEIAVPSYYSHYDEIPFLVKMQWRPKRYYEQYHSEVVSQVSWERMPTEKSLQLLQALSTQSDLSTSSGTPNISGTGAGNEVEGVSEYELWMKPNEQFEQGLVCRALSDSRPLLLKEAGALPGPLPHRTSGGQPLWPWVLTGYERFGGRVWSRSPLDDLVKKQDQLNQLDSLIQLIIQRMANPVWLQPKGAEVEHFTGEPGLVVKWNPLVAGGSAKPERLAGENVPPSLWRLREQLLNDIEQLGGTFDITKGGKPPGVEAFSALQLLVERAQSRFAVSFKSRGETYRRWLLMALELERQFGPMNRTAVVSTPNQGWAFQHFNLADLQGGVTIIVEDGSTSPKTNLGKRAAIEQMNQMRIIDPSDPDQKMAILRISGLTELSPTLDANVKSALREQDEFEKWAEKGMQGPSPLVVKMWHENNIHLTEHRKWANEDRTQALFNQAPQLEQLVAQHIIEHQMALQGQPTTPGPTPDPGEPVGAAQAMLNSNRESGSTADANTPGVAQPQAQTSEPQPPGAAAYAPAFPGIRSFQRLE